jgi:group II intron reverse transcriptase/maturase
LGVAALEDKLVQHAVVTILNHIYEGDFKGFSYGFRPGRSCHDAIEALHTTLNHHGCSEWVLDADIRGCFDHLSHEWAVTFLEHRVADPRLLRLSRKWLKAGVSEDGQWAETTVGTPQGAVVSPLLANGSLPYVFDRWVEAWRQTVAHGDVIVVRYADDRVVGFQHRAEADRFLAEFRDRLATFGLEVHAEKTRLIRFGRFAALNRRERGQGKPETFTFLGFTHYCGTRRSDGSFIVWRKTAKMRMAAKLRAIKTELQRRMHEPIPLVGEWVRKVVTGYDQYHAIPGNLDQLSVFHHRLRRLWARLLGRRSQRGWPPWQRLSSLLDRWIPPPRVLHPYPEQRFAARHPR